MTGLTVKTIDHPDGRRRVDIYQRSNGTFGFEELEYGVEEQAWYPVGRYSSAVIDIQDRAESEARSRVSGLSSEG